LGDQLRHHRDDDPETDDIDQKRDDDEPHCRGSVGSAGRGHGGRSIDGSAGTGNRPLPGSPIDPAYRTRLDNASKSAITKSTGWIWSIGKGVAMTRSRSNGRRSQSGPRACSASADDEMRPLPYTRTSPPSRTSPNSTVNQKSRARRSVSSPL